MTDTWDIVATFPTRAECEEARMAVDPPGAEPAAPASRTRFVCFPDTLDPQATP